MANNVRLSEGQLTLQAGEAILNQPGFEKIPVEEMGMYADAWRGGRQAE